MQAAAEMPLLGMDRTCQIALIRLYCGTVKPLGIWGTEYKYSELKAMTNRK
jgi:hypothetical protein